MEGMVIIIVGARGSGKSTIAKRLCAHVHPDRLYVYDAQGEYNTGDYDRLPHKDDFLTDVAGDRKTGELGVADSFIIFEEATVFFSNRGRDEKLTDFMVGARHDRNVIVLLFHSIRTIPLYVMDMANYAYVLQTNDLPDTIKRHEILYPTWLRVMKRPKSSYPNITYEIVSLQ